jgi:hypothetical protein
MALSALVVAFAGLFKVWLNRPNNRKNLKINNPQERINKEMTPAEKAELKHMLLSFVVFTATTGFLLYVSTTLSDPVISREIVALILLAIVPLWVWKKS